MFAAPHAWKKRRGVISCEVCRLEKPKLQMRCIKGGFCPGTDRLEIALADALAPEGTIRIYTECCDSWQERLGGNVAPWDACSTEFTGVVAVEVAPDGAMMVWTEHRWEGFGKIWSDCEVQDKYPSVHSPPVQMRKDSAFVRFIDGEAWVKPKK